MASIVYISEIIIMHTDVLTGKKKIASHIESFARKGDAIEWCDYYYDYPDQVVEFDRFQDIEVIGVKVVECKPYYKLRSVDE